MQHATRRDVTLASRTDGTSQTHTKTGEYSPLNQKSPGQRQALYSGIEGSSRSLLHSPLLNVHSLHRHTEHSGACVKIPSYTPVGTDSRFLLYLSLFVSSYTAFSTQCFPVHVFLLLVSTSVFPYLIFADTTVLGMSNTYADILCPMLTQF
jgi:hypothetical protein